MVPVPFKVQSGFCMYFMGKFNSSWYRIPRGKYMDGLSGLFRSPERRVNANLNTSLVRVIYITTTLELCPSTNRECGNLTNAPETQSSSSAACYSPCPSISKLHTPTAEMLLTRGNADQVQSRVSHPFTEAPRGPRSGNFSFPHHPSPLLNLCMAMKWFS